MAIYPVFRTAPADAIDQASPMHDKRLREHARWPCGLLSMKARTTIAVILEQRGTMPSAHKDAMAAPRLAGSVKIKIDSWFADVSITHTRHCFGTSGAW
jgi:hypothetical protein